jgi:hypothetical protein
MLGQSEIKVVCYLRRQDLFLESLYNQFVKQSPGFGGDLKSFITKASFVADYAGHLDVWSRMFGPDRIFAISYDDVSGELVNNFVRQALELEAVDSFKMPPGHINERLSPDLLLFKRIINRLKLPLAEGYVAFLVITKMARMENAGNVFTSFMSNADKMELVAGYEAVNRHVATKYCRIEDGSLFAFPEDGVSEAHPGSLSVEKGLELYLRYSREMNRLPVRGEVYLRTIARKILSSAPWLEFYLGGIRRLINRWRARREWRGQ